jgi:hypothetical protein
VIVQVRNKRIVPAICLYLLPTGITTISFPNFILSLQTSLLYYSSVDLLCKAYFFVSLYFELLFIKSKILTDVSIYIMHFVYEWLLFWLMFPMTTTNIPFSIKAMLIQIWDKYPNIYIYFGLYLGHHCLASIKIVTYILPSCIIYKIMDCDASNLCC